MRRYSGFEHERVLLYHSRMQHIVGHCDPTPEIKSTRPSGDPLAALDGQKPKPPVWTLCSPKYKFKRAASLVAAQQRQRPSNAANGSPLWRVDLISGVGSQCPTMCCMRLWYSRTRSCSKPE